MVGLHSETLDVPTAMAILEKLVSPQKVLVVVEQTPQSISLATMVERLGSDDYKAKTPVFLFAFTARIKVF